MLAISIGITLNYTFMLKSSWNMETAQRNKRVSRPSFHWSWMKYAIDFYLWTQAWKDIWKCLSLHTLDFCYSKEFMTSTNIIEDEENSLPETKDYCLLCYIGTDPLKAPDTKPVKCQLQSLGHSNVPAKSAVWKSTPKLRHQNLCKPYGWPVFGKTAKNYTYQPGVTSLQRSISIPYLQEGLQHKKRRSLWQHTTRQKNKHSLLRKLTWHKRCGKSSAGFQCQCYDGCEETPFLLPWHSLNWIARKAFYIEGEDCSQEQPCLQQQHCC